MNRGSGGRDGLRGCATRPEALDERTARASRRGPSDRNAQVACFEDAVDDGDLLLADLEHHNVALHRAEHPRGARMNERAGERVGARRQERTRGDDGSPRRRTISRWSMRLSRKRMSPLNIAGSMLPLPTTVGEHAEKWGREVTEVSRPAAFFFFFFRRGARRAPEDDDHGRLAVRNHHQALPDHQCREHHHRQVQALERELRAMRRRSRDNVARSLAAPRALRRPRHPEPTRPFPRDALRACSPRHVSAGRSAPARSPSRPRDDGRRRGTGSGTATKAAQTPAAGGGPGRGRAADPTRRTCA